MPDFNFGHLVWEEMVSIYLTMKRFGIAENSSIVMDAQEYSNSKNKDRYQKFTSFFLPIITDQKMQSTWSYLDSYDKDFVCFKKLLVPSFSRFFLDFRDSFNEGKEPLLFQFRNDVLSYYGLDPFSKPTKHRILISNKRNSANFRSSIWRTHFRSIANENQLFEFLKEKYSHIRVDMIDLADLSLEDQLQEMLDTTILITPNGGVSMIMPFIAIDSYAIIMDYLGGQKKELFHYSHHESASMEISFWNLWPHFNKMYYQVFSKRDLKEDFPSAKSYRDSFSVLVNFHRIEFMINEALQKYVF
jgi:hypothetical protein